MKKGSAVPGEPLDLQWWPLPELTWGHEDFQSIFNGVSATRAGPFYFVLLMDSSLRHLA